MWVSGSIDHKTKIIYANVGIIRSEFLVFLSFVSTVDSHKLWTLWVFTNPNFKTPVLQNEFLHFPLASIVNQCQTTCVKVAYLQFGEYDVNDDDETVCGNNNEIRAHEGSFVIVVLFVRLLLFFIPRWNQNNFNPKETCNYYSNRWQYFYY